VESLTEQIQSYLIRSGIAVTNPRKSSFLFARWQRCAIVCFDWGFSSNLPPLFLGSERPHVTQCATYLLWSLIIIIWLRLCTCGGTWNVRTCCWTSITTWSWRISVFLVRRRRISWVGRTAAVRHTRPLKCCRESRTTDPPTTSGALASSSISWCVGLLHRVSEKNSQIFLS